VESEWSCCWGWRGCRTVAESHSCAASLVSTLCAKPARYQSTVFAGLSPKCQQKQPKQILSILNLPFKHNLSPFLLLLLAPQPRSASRLLTSRDCLLLALPLCTSYSSFISTYGLPRACVEELLRLLPESLVTSSDALLQHCHSLPTSTSTQIARTPSVVCTPPPSLRPLASC
jgi:hypothetical protein